MKIIDFKNASEGDVESWHSFETQSEVLGHKSYHELADFPIVEVDALSRLQANIQMLEDLQGRLSFVMKEVRYLLKA